MTIDQFLAHVESGDRSAFRKADLQKFAKVVRAADEMASYTERLLRTLAKDGVKAGDSALWSEDSVENYRKARGWDE